MIALLLALAAQQPKPASATAAMPVAGVVLQRRGVDSLPAAGVTVVLHRVGKSKQGPVDSVQSDPTGHFRFRFLPDTGSLYLVSARFRGIEYFAPPLSRDVTKPDLAVRIVVYDTSHTTPLTVASRHLVIGAPEASGVRAVADLILIENAGALTRLAGDSTHPTWAMRLPRGAEQVELGESDFAADAMGQRGDTLILNASVPPGKREFTLTYRIPAGAARFEIPVDHDVPVADLLTEETTLKASGGLTRGDTITVVERHFTKWGGVLAAGTPVLLEFGGTAAMPTGTLPLLIGVLGLALLGMSVVAQRRAARLRAPVAGAPVLAPTAPGLPPAATALLDRIAALDAEHAGGRDAVGADAWAEYLRQRAALKAELTALLPR